jgi:hypothetical protein
MRTWTFRSISPGGEMSSVERMISRAQSSVCSKPGTI